MKYTMMLGSKSLIKPLKQLPKLEGCSRPHSSPRPVHNRRGFFLVIEPTEYASLFPLPPNPSRYEPAPSDRRFVTGGQGTTSRSACEQSPASCRGCRRLLQSWHHYRAALSPMCAGTDAHEPEAPPTP